LVHSFGTSNLTLPILTLPGPGEDACRKQIPNNEAAVNTAYVIVSSILVGPSFWYQKISYHDTQPKLLIRDSGTSFWCGEPGLYVIP